MAINAVRMLAAAAVIALGFGLWDFTNGPIAASRAATTHAQNDISGARQTISAAQSQDPGQALVALSQAQQKLDRRPAQRAARLHQRRQRAVGAGDGVDARRAEGADSLQHDQRYQAGLADRHADLLRSPARPPKGTTGASTTLSAISGFTAVEPPATKAGAAPPAAQMLYALSGGVLYQIEHGDRRRRRTGVGRDMLPARHRGDDRRPRRGRRRREPLRARLADRRRDAGGLGAAERVRTPTARRRSRRALMETVPVAAGQTPSALAVSGATAYVAFSGTGGPGVWETGEGRQGRRAGDHAAAARRLAQPPRPPRSTRCWRTAASGSSARTTPFHRRPSGQRAAAD